LCFPLFVWFARAALLAMVLQPFRWRCVECAVHHERDVREEQHPYTVYMARTNNNRVTAARDFYCLLPQCEASGIPIAKAEIATPATGKACNECKTLGPLGLVCV